MASSRTAAAATPDAVSAVHNFGHRTVPNSGHQVVPRAASARTGRATMGRAMMGRAMMGRVRVVLDLMVRTPAAHDRTDRATTG